jgi:hypothetical protein
MIGCRWLGVALRHRVLQPPLPAALCVLTQTLSCSLYCCLATSPQANPILFFSLFIPPLSAASHPRLHSSSISPHAAPAISYVPLPLQLQCKFILRHAAVASVGKAVSAAHSEQHDQPFGCGSCAA